jgi:iron complex transport system ATP-binding protein
MSDAEPALETVASGKTAMIDFWGRLTRADKSAALRLLQQVECGYLKNREWRVLSQGERQRVLIGRALMAKPRVLILDEPCAGLDPAAREKFLHFLQRLGSRKNSPALILVTHHVEEIMPVFSHVLLLQDGRRLVAGKMADVLNSQNLAHAFGVKMKLAKSGRRFTLQIQ